MRSYKNFSLVLIVLMLSLACPNEHAKSASKSSEQTVARARALIDEDRIEPALTILNSLLSREPANAWALSERSRAFRKTGKIEKADIDANKAVALAPKSAVVRINRVSKFLGVKQYQIALEECDRAISLEPRFDQAYTMRASVLERFSKYDEALRNCDRAISLAPNSPENYFLRGSTLKRKGQAELAALDLRKALELSEKSPHYSHIRRGCIYFLLDKFDETISECAAGLQLNPRSPDAHYLRANAYSRLGHFQNEIDELTEALKLTPKDVDLYELRAVAEYKLFQHSAVIEDCKKAFELSPASKLKPLLAATYDELGQNQEAALIRSQLTSYERTTAASDDGQKIQFEVNLKNNAVLPFTYDEGGKLAVPVAVDGHSLQLMLDTGAAITGLWRPMIQTLGLNSTFDRSVERADGTKRSLGQILVKEFEIGTAQFKNVKFDVRDELANNKMLSGVFGGNMLENFVVKIDYANKKIVLTKSCDADISKDAIIVPLLIRNNSPYCFVRIDDKFERPALLDTGSPSCIAADAMLEPVLPTNMKYDSKVNGPWLGNIDSETIRLKKIGFADYNLVAPLCEVFPASKAPRAANDITIGNDLLSGFKTVTFDYPGRRVIFEPNATTTNSAWSACNEARFSLRQHDDKKAIEYLNQFLSLEPEAGKTYFCIRGKAHLRLKEYKEGLEDFDHFLRDCPGDPYGLVMRANAHAYLQEFDEQIEDDTAAIKSDPSYRLAYENRAWAYEMIGETQLAESDRETAKKLK